MYIEELEISNYLSEENAVVVSNNGGTSRNSTRHTAWLNSSTGIVIAAEFSEEYGNGIFLYEDIDDYLDNFEDTWVLENNKLKEVFDSLT